MVICVDCTVSLVLSQHTAIFIAALWIFENLDQPQAFAVPMAKASLWLVLCWEDLGIPVPVFAAHCRGLGAEFCHCLCLVPGSY